MASTDSVDAELLKKANDILADCVRYAIKSIETHGAFNTNAWALDILQLLSEEAKLTQITLIRASSEISDCKENASHDQYLAEMAESVRRALPADPNAFMNTAVRAHPGLLTQARKGYVHNKKCDTNFIDPSTLMPGECNCKLYTQAELDQKVAEALWQVHYKVKRSKEATPFEADHISGIIDEVLNPHTPSQEPQQ